MPTKWRWYRGHTFCGWSRFTSIVSSAQRYSIWQVNIIDFSTEINPFYRFLESDKLLPTYFTSLCPASYVRWRRGTTRIRPPHAALLCAVQQQPGSQQQTCSSGFAAVCPRWDRRTDGQTDARQMLDCANNTIRYDTRCYFIVRSKADISQLNLPHGTDN